MKASPQFLIFFTVTSAAVVIVKQTNAATLTGNNLRGYDARLSVQNNLGNEIGVINAHGYPISLLAPPAKNSLFQQILTATFPSSQGWQFTPATSSLPGNFNIDFFLPNVAPAKPFSDPANPYVLIPAIDEGSQIQLRYIPPPTSTSKPSPSAIVPSPLPNTLHWIQQVTRNIQGGPHSGIYNFIDIDSTQNNPFYDLNPKNRPLPDKYTFIDFPGLRTPATITPTTTITDTFIAQLYLVGVADPINAPQKVTIYDGISWAWQNQLTPPSPKPNSSPKSTTNPPACNSGGSGGGGCGSVFSARTVMEELPLSDFDSGEVFVPPESVPEPTTILGILGIGVWGAALRLKRKNHKQ